jgi:hypothetical protein
MLVPAEARSKVAQKRTGPVASESQAPKHIGGNGSEIECTTLTAVDVIPTSGDAQSTGGVASVRVTDHPWIGLNRC